MARSLLASRLDVAARIPVSLISAFGARVHRVLYSLWDQVSVRGQKEYLLIAALLHVVAFVVSLFGEGLSFQTFTIALGLTLILLAMQLPLQSALGELREFSPPAAVPNVSLGVAAAEARPQSRRENELGQMMERPNPSSASSSYPVALPFMGHRLLIAGDPVSVARLARAATKLNHISAARAHPWGELMARVSHELRTPLNAVIGFSDMMNAELLGPLGNPRYNEYARHIRDCGRELLKSAEDTLAITCLLDCQAPLTLDAPLDLELVVADAWHFFSDEVARRRLRLEQVIPEGLMLMIERRPMRQTLINLFAEAVHRAGDGGVIGFTATSLADLVQIEVFVRGRSNSQSIGEASLSICLARALLELQGAALVEVDDPGATWRALTVLRCAAQHEFFGVTHPRAREPLQLS